MLVRLLSCALLLPILVQAGTFDKPVIPLGLKEFNKVMKEDRMSMVVFYAPWCGHCKSLAPEFAQAATSLAPIVPFYSVDCDEDANKPLCAKYDVKGFPTIKGFTRGTKIAPKDYTGERKRAGLVGWASSMVGDKVKKMKVPSKGGITKEDGLKEVGAFLKGEPAKPHVLLIHPNSASIPLMWKAISQQRSAYSFGYIRDADHAVKDALAVSGLNDKPKVIFWREGKTTDDLSTGWESFEGPLKFDSLLAWLSPTTPFFADPSGSSPDSSDDPSATAPSSPPGPNASQLQRAADRAKAEARWVEEERRDRERLARMEEKKRLRKLAEEAEEAGGGSGTEEAGAKPAAAPGLSSSEHGEAEAEGAVKEPVPAGSVEEGERAVAEKARETAKDALVTEGQEKVVEVQEEGVGRAREEVVPELKVVELEVEGERKRDEL